MPLVYSGPPITHTYRRILFFAFLSPVNCSLRCCTMSCTALRMSMSLTQCTMCSLPVCYVCDHAHKFCSHYACWLVSVLTCMCNGNVTGPISRLLCRDKTAAFACTITTHFAYPEDKANRLVLCTSTSLTNVQALQQHGGVSCLCT